MIGGRSLAVFKKIHVKALSKEIPKKFIHCFSGFEGCMCVCLCICDPDAGKNWRQEEKGMTKHEMVGCHLWFYGHEFEQTPGVGDGQGSLVWCSPWGRKESETTEWLNWTKQREYSTSNLCTGRSLKINFNFGFCVQCMSRFLLFPRVSSLPSVFMSFSYHLAYFMVIFSLGGIFGHKVPHPIFKRGQEVANYICWKPSVCQVLWHMDCLVWCSENLWAIHDSNCLFYFQSSLHRALYCPGGFVYCPV